MKTHFLPSATWRLLLVGGASGLGGWLLGSAASPKAGALGSLASVAATQAPPAWSHPDSLDALVAAPTFHRILFENERVRVLEVTVPPHTREPLHTHRWPSVMYRTHYGTGRYYDATEQLVHEFTKAPQPGGPSARWQEPEAPHAVENTGEEADRFVRVELKP